MELFWIVASESGSYYPCMAPYDEAALRRLCPVPPKWEPVAAFTDEAKQLAVCDALNEAMRDAMPGYDTGR
jgi:hypothetical protein